MLTMTWNLADEILFYAPPVEGTMVNQTEKRAPAIGRRAAPLGGRVLFLFP